MDSGFEAIVSRVRRSLARDRSLPLSEKLIKGMRYGAALVSAPFLLRGLRVGARPRTRGAPLVESFGSISMGDDVQLNCAFSPVELRTGKCGRIDIGHGVDINFGAVLSAKEHVRIGSHVSLGPYVRVVDHDESGTAPIEIGDDVWLATRVVVEKGARIGNGTIVTAGSVVRGELPPNVIAGGNPARVIRGEPVTVVEKVKIAPEHRVLVIGDFTTNELAARLEEHTELGPVLEATSAPFDQVMQSLHASNGEHDVLFVWARPERISPAFARRLEGDVVSEEEILADVDTYARAIEQARAKVVLVASFVMPPHVRGLGMIDLHEGGLAHAIARMNQRLAQRVTVLDASRWIDGSRCYSSKLWYLGKVGWSPSVFAAAAEDIRAAIRGVTGRAKKLLVLDLDDTLWGGIVGDVGWEALRLGGHDAIGEAFVDFQKQLRALSKRGIALAIVSKNEESIALEAIERHESMLLRKKDFVAWRINWRDKAANIDEIARELNVGLQSVVFIDDNPIERARVREALPEVYVPEWPEDKTRYVEAFAQLRCFDVPRISKEDLERARMYSEEKQRTELRSRVGSIDEWLESLGTKVSFARLDPSNIARATQLLNKTNQMNVRTRRLSEAELASFASEHETWVVSVSDRLGDAGLTGIVSVECNGDDLTVIDWVLSCRVMGRRVEETLAWFACHRAIERGARRVLVPFFPTAKNKPCRDFWDRSGFQKRDDIYVCDSLESMNVPRGIEVVGR